MRKHRPLSWAAAMLGALLVAGSASAAPPTDTQSLRDAVTVAGIKEHLAALNAIANANVFEGIPTRATGTPGKVASENYVIEKMTAAGFQVTTQSFDADIFFEQGPAAFEQVSPNAVTYPRFDGQDGVWYTADFSGDGDVTKPITVVDFKEPTTTASNSSAGCETSDFAGFPTGNIALIQRGTCDFGLKVENAKAAGASGVILFNEGTIGQPDRIGILIPTLAGYDASGVPVVGTDYATGRELLDLTAGGTVAVTVHLKVDGFINEDVLTNNIIAETPGGRADRVVVVGGHLDSVYEGPGINDDGSGVSTMLETAEQMNALGINPVNKVRFIFFSGEEQGLLGSDYYVSQLTKKQIQNISVMLDFDMLASPNYARLIYDGNGDEQGIAGPNGSGQIEQVFKNFWDSQGLKYETIPFDGRSDYDAFTQVVHVGTTSVVVETEVVDRSGPSEVRHARARVVLVFVDDEGRPRRPEESVRGPLVAAMASA